MSRIEHDSGRGTIKCAVECTSTLGPLGVETCLKQICCEAEVSVYLRQERVCWQAVVNTGVNQRVPQKTENPLIASSEAI